MSWSNPQKLARLQDRASFLRGRIEAGDGSEGALSYMRQELAALEWAIPPLQAMVATTSVEARDVVRQRTEAAWRNVAADAIRRLRAAGLEGPRITSPEVAQGVEVILNRWATQAAYGVGKVPPADDTRRTG